jgi:Tfp pilus assembly protein PilV
MQTALQLPAASSLGYGRRRGISGLTLVEVMISCGMIVIVCTSFMMAFTQLNQMAMVSRLYTGAYAQAQSQIDLISTDTPFEPQNNLVPSELTPGTTTATVTVYHDPISNNTINGTMTTTVTTNNSTYTQGSTTETLYLYEAYVNVSYTYRGKSYSVAFSTLRTSDI